MPNITKEQRIFLHRLRQLDNDSNSVMCNAAYNYPLPVDLSDKHSDFYTMINKILFQKESYTKREGELINEFVKTYRKEIESELNELSKRFEAR